MAGTGGQSQLPAAAPGAMESLVGGIKLALEVVVGRLYRAMVLLVKHVTEAPQSFARDIPLFAVVLALLIWRRCVLRRRQEVARRFAAQLEEDLEFMQNLGLTQASEARGSPAEGASPPRLQTLCLFSADPQQEMAGLDSLPEDSLNKEETSEVREHSFPGEMTARLEVQTRLFKESSNTPQGQVAETKNTLEVSQKKITLIEKEMLDHLVKIAIPQENMQLFSQEAEKWSEGAWEMREEQQTCVKIQMNE